MSDTVFIIFMFSLIAANIVFCIWVLSGDKRDKKDVGTILKASDDMITGLERFMDSFPKMTEEFVSNVTPAIDSYIKERVEAYIQANAMNVPTVTDIQELDSIRESVDNFGTDIVPRGDESAPDYKPKAQGLSFDEIATAIENVCASELYKATFLHEPEKAFRASTGKQVNIRPEYHRNILLILEAAGCDCITLTGFLDNVLAHHFKNYGNNIGKIINSRFTNPESL